MGRTKEDLAALKEMETLFDDGEIYIFTPSITLIEVLACKLSPEEEARFQSLLLRSNMEVVSVTRRIANIAREIRSHYRANGDEIAVADSIHIATAIHFEATALHTYDGCGKRTRKTDLLKLAVPIIGKYDLLICKPEVPPKPEAITEEVMAALRGPSLFDQLNEIAEEEKERLALPSSVEETDEEK